MSRQPRLSLASIVASAAAPPARVPADPPTLVVPAPADARSRGTLKERAKQLSVYLEPPVYDQLRELAYTERTKIHGLMLEALDLLFKARGALSIGQLTDDRQ